MIGFSVKHIIKKTQEKMHKQLQCKLHVLKNVGINALNDLSGKNMLKKFSEKCMKAKRLCIFHY